MKITDITQIPNGTIVSLDKAIPSEGVVGSYLTVDESVLYKVKGTPSNIWTEVFLEKTNELIPGQEIKFIRST